MRYFLINNTIKKGSKMPIINEQWHTYNANLLKWSESLQPCEISESELEKVITYLQKNDYVGFLTQIDVTDIVEEEINIKSNSTSTYTLIFKQPKQVDVEIEAVDVDLVWTDVCISIVNRENNKVPFIETLKYLKSKYKITRNI